MEMMELDDLKLFPTQSQPRYRPMTSELGIIEELTSFSGMNILNTTSLEKVVILRNSF
jgi:hypothetical protein